MVFYDRVAGLHDHIGDKKLFHQVSELAHTTTSQAAHFKQQ